MKTPVIFILVPIITWCTASRFFFLSIIASPTLLGKIKKINIDNQIDKLNSNCSNFTEILKQETYPKLWDCVHIDIDRNSTICETAYNVIQNCTLHVKTVFENCVTNDHKYWPSLIKKSAMSVQQYLCETRGGSIIELRNPCIRNKTKDIKEKFKKQKELLVLKEKYKKYNNTGTLPFPKEFCESVSGDVRKYLSVRLNTTCHNQETRSAILNLYDAIMAPCKQYDADENHRTITYTDDTEF